MTLVGQALSSFMLGNFKELPEHHVVQIHNRNGKFIWIDLTYAIGLLQSKNLHLRGEDNWLFDLVKHFMHTGEVLEACQPGLVNLFERKSC